ncbi:MAG TPA: diguanylate cyclase [Pyrinomonadaceae bacterium]|nr:diguanylate cyclase [Pyrinomonadaceae bacterium]
MRILIAEDETVSRRVLRMTLESWGHEVSEAADGAIALQLLQSDTPPKLAILDLSMPEMDGITVCQRVRQTPSATPVYIILLTANTSKALIVTGLEAGADDYVTKPFDTDELHARVKVGMRMVELQQSLAQRVAELELAQESLRNLSLTDDLTGLYNRRGFFTLAEQHLSSARRAKREASLIYIDMDGLKDLNDTHGHEVGSLALREVADILRETFRSSDLIARIGGDEFVIFETYLAPNDGGTGVARLQQNVSQHNAAQARDYKISLSIGVAPVAFDASLTLEELLKNGDRMMYEQKRNRRR